MNTRRITAMALRIIRQFLRDRRTLALVFVVPVIVFTLFGILFKSESSDIRIGVIDNDAGARRTIMQPPSGFPPIPVMKKIKIKVAEKFIEALKESKEFEILSFRDGKPEDVIKENGLDGLLIFSKDFSRDVVQGRGLKLRLIIAVNNLDISMAGNKFIYECFLDNRKNRLNNFLKDSYSGY